MAGDDGQERSEQPTARRREKAREEGRIPRSAELSAATVLLAGTTALAAAGGGALGTFSTRVLRESAGALSAGEMTPVGATALIRGLTTGLLGALAPFATGVVAVTVLVNLVQSGASFSTAPLTPKLSHLSPMAGFKRLMSLDAVVNLLKAVIKLAALGGVTWLVIRGHWGELMALPEAGAPAVAAVARDLTLRLCFVTGLAFLVVAGADYAWQRFRHEKSLRMTRQEIQLEHRESEGDPHLKAHIRALQRARARQRMLQGVPKADVVVTNPTHVAVALRYAPEESAAPIVVAMGERKLAQRIKDIARRSGVPLVENKPVARALLATCTIGQAIPPALYAAVAEILAYVFRRAASLRPGDAGRIAA